MIQDNTQLQQEMLKQIDLIQEKGPEYYNVLISLVTTSLCIKKDTIHMICSTPDSFGMLEPFINSANEAISKSAEGLEITKQEIDIFCNDARKNINNNAMSVGEMMLLRILLPLVSMTVTSNQTKDQVFELLATLKEANKL